MAETALAQPPSIERRLRTLEDEKYSLLYEWLKAQGRKDWSQLDYREAEKATAKRRREILDEMRTLRAERKTILVARRAERETNAKVKRERKQAERAAITKECQICENQQCVTRDGRMVHHGYRRPGYGSIEGDCFGVGRLPYPATDALREYLSSCRVAAAQARHSLEKLPEQTELLERNLSGYGSTWRKMDEVDPIRWKRLVRSCQWRLESDIRWFESETKRAEKRIAAAQAA